MKSTLYVVKLDAKIQGRPSPPPTRLETPRASTEPPDLSLKICLHTWARVSYCGVDVIDLSICLISLAIYFDQGKKEMVSSLSALPSKSLDGIPR